MKCFPQLVFLAMLNLATVAHAEVQTQEIEYSHKSTTLNGFLAHDSAIKAKRP